MRTYGTKAGKDEVSALSKGWTKAQARVARAKARQGAAKVIAKALKEV